MKLKLFTASFVLALAGFSLLWYVQRPVSRPEMTRVGKGVYITSQLKPEQVGRLRASRINAIIDMRPDGEAADQPTSSTIEAEAKRRRLKFHYIPTPHGEIPDTVVDQLREALDEAGDRTLLYCRTGRRAVRAYALVEATRAGGPPVDDILKMTRHAGFPADDLRESLTRRIEHRGPNAEPANQAVHE